MNEWERLRSLSENDLAREVYRFSRAADDRIDQIETIDDASVAVNEKRAMRALRILSELNRSRAEAIAEELGYPKP